MNGLNHFGTILYSTSSKMVLIFYRNTKNFLKEIMSTFSMDDYCFKDLDYAFLIIKELFI